MDKNINLTTYFSLSYYFYIQILNINLTGAIFRIEMHMYMLGNNNVIKIYLNCFNYINWALKEGAIKSFINAWIFKWLGNTQIVRISSRIGLHLHVKYTILRRFKLWRDNSLNVPHHLKGAYLLKSLKTYRLKMLNR